MKKSKLIEMLNAIDGDPDIKLWNGYAGDFMDIDAIVPSHLVKITFNFYMEMCRLERCMDTGEDRKTFVFSHEEMQELRDCYKKNYDWEFNEYVTAEDIAKKNYTQKRIMILNAKTRGKKTFDRIGCLEY